MQWIAPTGKDSAAGTLEKRLWDAAGQFRANSGIKFTLQRAKLPPHGQAASAYPKLLSDAGLAAAVAAVRAGGLEDGGG